MPYEPNAHYDDPKPPMPDCGEWVGKLKSFYEKFTSSDAEIALGEFSTAGVCSEADLSDIDGQLPFPTPQSLRTFFQTGTSELRFVLAFVELPEVEPELFIDCFGEAHKPLLSLHALPKYVKSSRDFISNGDAPKHFPERFALWNRVLPFLESNADYLALDPILDREDPFVVYLSHDDEDQFVSRNLASFLIEWERACYVSPNMHELQFFMDNATEAFSADTETAIELRDALTQLGIVSK